jgi:predicted ATPase
MTKKYVLTGGPGVGKSTLIEQLQKNGIYTLGEISEYIINIESKKENGILPWTNRTAFQELVLQTQLTWEKEIPLENRIAIQDRGIPDGIAYYLLDNLQPPQEMYEAAIKANYTAVFLLDPLEKYQQTAVRVEDKEKAMKLHEMIAQVYTELGYKILKIPPISIERRTELILSNLRN